MLHLASAAETVASVVVLAGVGLSALAVLTSKRVQEFFRARGNAKVADELEDVHELAHVLVQVLDGHEHGETVLQALLDAEKSPEAQDLIHKAIAKVRGS
jgi:hypothetical protein